MSHPKKIFLRIVVLMLMFFCIFRYKQYSKEKDINIIILKLEKYKNTHSDYPTNIKKLKLNFQPEIYYYPNSKRQFFQLAFTHGIMDANTNTYDSRTKKWTEKFNY